MFYARIKQVFYPMFLWGKVKIRTKVGKIGLSLCFINNFIL